MPSNQATTDEQSSVEGGTNRHRRPGQSLGFGHRVAHSIIRPDVSAPLVLTLAITALAYPVYLRLARASVGSDILAHARLVEQVMASGHPFSYSAWYPFISFVTDGSTDIDLILEASIVALTIATTVKVLLCYAVARRITGSPNGSTAVALLVFAAMPLLNPLAPRDIYLGQITPNVWHNSTLVFALPMGVAAFVAGVAFCKKITLKSASVLGALLLLSTLAKPNFTLALGLALGIFAILQLFHDRRGALEAIGILAVAFLPSASLLAYQYFATFVAEGVVSTTLTIAPFETWGFFSTNIPLSLALSLLGPALTLVAVGRERRRNPMFVVSWAALGVAIAQLSLLGELTPEGTLSGHGNHFWGAYSAIFMVFLVSGIALVREMRDLASEEHSASTSPAVPRPLLARALKVHAAVLVMALHFATGLYYMSRIGVGDFTAF